MKIRVSLRKRHNLEVDGVIYYHTCAGANNNTSANDYVGESLGEYARAATARNAENFSTGQTTPAIMQQRTKLALKGFFPHLHTN